MNLPKGSAQFSFAGFLNDFLAPAERRRVILLDYKGRPAIKDPIESMGVPHTEVEYIMVNNQAVSFAYRLQDGDSVSVHPYDSPPDTGSASLQPTSPVEKRFILDIHLAALTRNLRMLGLDCLHGPQFTDQDLIRIADTDGRILLSRSRKLLKHRAVLRGQCIRSALPADQTREVIRRHALQGSLKPFSRCITCNGLKDLVAKEEIIQYLPHMVADLYSSFTRCRDCGSIYWEGSHYQRMRVKIDRIIERN